MRDLDGFYGSNQIFIEFKDYVVVFDSSVIPQAWLLEKEISARTSKPVRYVIHSHFHPDHTAGAAVFARRGGVEILAAAAGRPTYENWARKDFERKKAADPETYKGLQYPAPTRYIEKTLVFDDGRQRLEVTHFGHGHTRGDLVGWLPKDGILLTGDVCENKSFNNLANANIAEWIRVLDTLLAMPVKVVVPGHGRVGGPELLRMNRRYLVALREEVKGMVERGMSYEEVRRSVSVPFYEKWAGVSIRNAPRSIAVVYQEVGGKLPWSRRRIILGTAAGMIAAGVLLAFLLRRRFLRR